MKKILLTAMLCCSLSLGAQQYVGMAGLIHVPTADLDSAGVARIGAHYVPKAIMPDEMRLDGEKFNSLTNYLSITPFSWIEVGYGYTLWRMHRNRDPSQKTGFYSKDRYFSISIRPVKEGRWWPSVVIGGNDVWGSGEKGASGSNFYRNFYLALSKHIDVSGQSLGLHVTYRKWKKDGNRKWDGVVGGVTLQPSFYRQLRFIGEWTGNEVNLGVDCRVLKYILLQASMIDCRYPTGGLCVYIPLF